MSADKRWRIVCYDISDPKIYRQAYKVLRGHGRRLQYSIFRCRMDDRETEQLRLDLARILDPRDKLLIIDLCPTCATRVVARNHLSDWTGEPAGFTLVGRRSRTPEVPADEPPPNAQHDESAHQSSRNQQKTVRARRKAT